MNDPMPYLQALAQIDGPRWLTAGRHTALNRFLAGDWPSRREEAWKYTSLDHLGRQSLHAPQGHDGDLVCGDSATAPSHGLSFIDGRLSCHGTHLPETVAGTLGHLGDTRMVQDHLGRLAGEGILSSLNLALWTDGAWMHVPADRTISVPVFASYAGTEAEAMLHSRTLAVLEHGAEAALVEHFLGCTAAPYWQNAVCEIFLADGARLTHVRVLEEGAAATHTGATHVRLGRGSVYRALHVGLGGQLAHDDVVVHLDQPEGQAHLDALEWTGVRRHADLQLRVNHNARRTTSRITWRGIADGRGHGVFNGHVVVAHDAHVADARQSCRGLLLSGQAEIDVMPRLEIYADDVRCSHGASVGNLDEAALFYLRSRGIPPDVARGLLLLGFAAEALGVLDEPGLGGWLTPRVTRALGQGAGPAGQP